MTPLPLLAGSDLDAPFAWRTGRPISRRQFLTDVTALAARLPARGAALNLATDRYHFSVGLGAALVRGHTSLLPPNRTPDMIERLRRLFDGTYCLADAQTAPVDLPTVPYASGHAPAPLDTKVPLIGADLIAAQVLTSGSTAAPVPHAKPWALLVESARAEATRLAESMDRASLDGVALVATVPAQHMYGFESTILVPLLGGAAFDPERPFYPADIAEALARLPRPRMFVTTPLHLKMLLDSNVALAPIDLTVCATAPLSPQLAARAEAALGAPLVEIYGCTEAGQVATRRTVAGAEWRTSGDVRLAGAGDRTTVDGGHVPTPTLLADVLEVIDAQHFRLLGRSNDLINIAGKRNSLGHLNYHLNTIEGVIDGAFWMPPERGSEPDVVRLVAFVVAPGVTSDAVLAALRGRVDAAFLPRRIVHLAALPRDATGKLPADRLAALAKRWLAQSQRVAVHRDQRIQPAATNPTALQIAEDHPSFAGHFPGRPLLPGAALLAEVLEAVLADPELAAAVGPAPRLGVAKFLAPVGPGAVLSLRFEATPTTLRFEISNGKRLAASGHFERSANAMPEDSLSTRMPIAP
jgi:acyl-CoA synthetase (AMP-forming)/AMP-acid ligase II/3-hydroxymyristoyl/3-hydroxydecanoyl-(acyl carrier protein) dehydratase